MLDVKEPIHLYILVLSLIELIKPGQSLDLYDLARPVALVLVKFEMAAVTKGNEIIQVVAQSAALRFMHMVMRDLGRRVTE
jgi:hypothetical protein